MHLSSLIALQGLYLNSLWSHVRREAVKMVLLLPLLLPRLLVILLALLFMATCSFIGGLGWCAVLLPRFLDLHFGVQGMSGTATQGRLQLCHWPGLM